MASGQAVVLAHIVAAPGSLTLFIGGAPHMRKFSILCIVCASWLSGVALGAEPVDLPALIRDLSAARPITREQAVAAIGRLGPAATEAAPAVAKLLEDQDP